MKFFTLGIYEFDLRQSSIVKAVHWKIEKELKRIDQEYVDIQCKTTKLPIIMKKLICATLFAILICGTAAFAQNKFEKSKVLTESEVPVVIMQAFEKDYSNLGKGTWKVYFSEQKSATQAKSIFTPERYEFTGKNNGEKIQLVYKANGELESSKGAGAKN